jgi:hypothetical protein
MFYPCVTVKDTNMEVVQNSEMRATVWSKAPLEKVGKLVKKFAIC